VALKHADYFYAACFSHHSPSFKCRVLNSLLFFIWIYRLKCIFSGFGNILKNKFRLQNFSGLIE